MPTYESRKGKYKKEELDFALVCILCHLTQRPEPLKGPSSALTQISVCFLIGYNPYTYIWGLILSPPQARVSEESMLQLSRYRVNDPLSLR